MGHRTALGPDIVDRVFDDVEPRRFLVKPARKDPLEAALGVANVELDEGAGQLLDFPRRRCLASAQPDDDVAEPDRLARPHGELARNAVALVEEADHRHALRHRRGAGCKLGHRLRNVDRIGFRFGGVLLILLLRSLRRAGAERQRGQGKTVKRPAHGQSGVQA
jgi:hypothetical protein